MSINRGRVRWQCRRALLELDLVFSRFLQERFDSLDESQLADLDNLLMCEDHDLWAMINGTKPCPERRWEEMVTLLRAQRTD